MFTAGIGGKTPIIPPRSEDLDKKTLQLVSEKYLHFLIGPIKIIVDGAIADRTAYLSRPYDGMPDTTES